ncbi:uncharacterized protein BROUX77_003473 [Berkeleyomyces rouxiae]|uniref:uncharacterized protein n=1 Tax=Berkeleyomyces rouxiae TaxID=2035830 RepID=UPI003B79383F
MPVKDEPYSSDEGSSASESGDSGRNKHSFDDRFASSATTEESLAYLRDPNHFPSLTKTLALINVTSPMPPAESSPPQPWLSTVFQRANMSKTTALLCHSVDLLGIPTDDVEYVRITWRLILFVSVIW